MVDNEHELLRVGNFDLFAKLNLSSNYGKSIEPAVTVANVVELLNYENKPIPFTLTDKEF